MAKKNIFVSFIILTLFVGFSNKCFSNEISVVVSISDYKINDEKYDEISDPDIYFSIFHNNSKLETSKLIRDSKFNSYGEMKMFGDYCQGISNFAIDDNLVVKFYDSDYDSGSVNDFWEWTQGSLYKYMATYRKQLELMNDKEKKYDDYEAYLVAKDDPEVKKMQEEIRENVIALNNRKNNKEETEYLGEIAIDVAEVIEKFNSGKEQHAANYEIKNIKTDQVVGKANLVIKKFDGIGSSIKVKSY